jgi:hypothetical protein
VVAIWESQQGWKKRGSDSWEDKVGEEIDVEDWWEELGGGQTEPVRSQVREFSDIEFERGVCCWQGGFEQHYKTGAGRVESREKGKLG